MSFRRIGLRSRLTATAVASAAVMLAVLVVAFNLALVARLRADGDNALRERAATVLRGLGTVDGRLSVIEAPDQGAIDAETWIFAGDRTLEQPAGADPRNQQAARGLATAEGFVSVSTTDARLYAAPARRAGRRLGTVVVGASLAPYEGTASSALLESVALGVIVLAVVAALSLWLIGRALRPVTRIAAQAADWDTNDLSRRFYTGEPHDELTSLASVLDGLLSRLTQSLRHEQQLTAEISHELRTPLAKILAEAELAAGENRSSAEHRTALRSITRNAHDLQRVLETLLASARATVSTGANGSDARASAERASAPLRESLGADGKVIVLVCDRPVRVAVDGDVVERILSPVLENAARYARERITLAIWKANGEAVFEIRDDGPGFDATDREAIFDPGFGAANGQAGAHPGVGLGLTLARRLARAAGGEVEATASSQGATFAVRLPSARAHDTRTERDGREGT